MTKKLHSIWKSQCIAALAFICFTLFTVTSCTKKSDSGGNDAAKFVGTWNGTACGSTGQLVLAAGSNGTTLTNAFNVGATGTSCFKSVALIINASGNNLTIPTQNFTDNCALSYTLSGSGSLSGNTLSLTINVSGAVPTTTCTFVGTK